jgi:hypothetical protein
MNYFMNSLKIVIPIFVAITIVVIIFNLTQNEIVEEQVAEFKNPSEIEGLLDKIKSEKLENEISENPFTPKPREWITSGPFQIDRSEYLLGEKIFVNIDSMNVNEKGKIITLRPINSTHYSSYHTMPFDGSGQRNNYYFTPDLSELRGICSVDELIGNWKMVFQGTKYSDLEFKVTEEMIPGYEERYETIVNKGNC